MADVTERLVVDMAVDPDEMTDGQRVESLLAAHVARARLDGWISDLTDVVDAEAGDHLAEEIEPAGHGIDLAAHWLDQRRRLQRGHLAGQGRRPYPLPLDWYLESIDAVSRGLGYEQMKKSLPWSEEHLELRMEWLPTCDRAAVIESHKSFQEEEIHSDLPKLAAPTLLIYAEKGGTISDAEADEIVRALKQGRKQRIDGAGHMIPWDRLDAFVSAVHEFVAH